MTPATTTLEAVRIVGGAGTGKTERLVARVAECVCASGPHGVAAFCATPQAARVFDRRLHERIGSAADGVLVTTPRAFALDVLGDKTARAFTGRDSRLLTAVEEKFLMEDVKVSGLRPKRLREMLKFFYRSWTELADDDPNWLLPGEEAELHALLKSSLGFMRGIIEPEAANLALHYLRENEAARSAHCFQHVVIDDYQCLSQASQVLIELAAKTSLTIAGDVNACVQTFDSYPYAAGLDEFADRYPHAKLEQLHSCLRSRATAQAVAGVLADPSFKESATILSDASEPGSFDLLASENPAAEFARIAEYVDAALHEGIHPSRVVVAVPNTTWAKNVVAALAARHLAAEVLPDRQPLHGDVRDLTRCAPARVLAALNLVANPRDATAWRCWCGFGDYLLNSAAFASLRATDIPLPDALAAAAAPEESKTGTASTQRVVAAYRDGLKLIAQVKGLEGRALLDEIARIVADDPDAAAPSIAVSLCLAGENGGVDDADSMARRARERLTAPVLRDENAIAVVPYDLATGLSPDTLVIAGFVNGFIPCRDYFDATVTPLDKQEKMHAADARRLYALAGKADRALAVSYFTSTDLETAGMLKLKIDRIKLRDGVRICSISPSDFLATLSNGNA